MSDQTIKFELHITGSLTLPEAPKHKDLMLVGFDIPHKIQAIKGVRTLIGTGLKESKEAVEKAGNFDPQLLIKDITNSALIKARTIAREYGLKLEVQVRDE